MPVSTTTLVERIARVIAGRVVSVNSGGDDAHAGQRVDEIWRDYEGDALSIIRTLREPSPEMVEVGDIMAWRRMIDAALEEAGERVPS